MKKERKNYYELSTGEEKQYLKEFNKLKYAKSLKYIKTSIFIFGISGYLISDMLSLFLDGMGRSIPDILTSVNHLCIAAIILSLIVEWYGIYIFKRWLRIKYDIEY